MRGKDDDRPIRRQSILREEQIHGYQADVSEGCRRKRPHLQQFSIAGRSPCQGFIVVIGEIGTIERPMIGVLVFFLLQNMLADYGSWYQLALGLIGIIVVLLAQQGLWGLFASRSGIQFFPVRRLLRGGPISMKYQRGPHG
jgi:branched-chain amino acid transport system permease protein